MKEHIIRNYFEKLKEANSPHEIDLILDEMTPLLKSSGIAVDEFMTYFKIHGNEIETKSLDHRNTISNSNKAQLILMKLIAKLNR